MKFEIILNLVSSNFAKNSSLAEVPITVFDNKDRQLEELRFYDGYSITKHSKDNLRMFCEKYNGANPKSFIVKIFLDSVCIYDENQNFKLKLERLS